MVIQPMGSSGKKVLYYEISPASDTDTTHLGQVDFPVGNIIMILKNKGYAYNTELNSFTKVNGVWTTFTSNTTSPDSSGNRIVTAGISVSQDLANQTLTIKVGNITYLRKNNTYDVIVISA